jgi:sugar/nucleoside kinase (ribokinase family)
MFDITTIGDSTIDTFLHLEADGTVVSVNKKHKTLTLGYGAKIGIDDTAQSVGGNAANVAVGLARLGHKTSIVTELGDDINGHMIADHFKSENVNTSLTRFVPHDTRYSVVLNVLGERTILSGKSKRNYVLPNLKPTQAIYYTSLGASFEKLQSQLIKHLTKHPEIFVAMNPGSYQIAHGKESILKMIPYTDLLLLNKEEAYALTGLSNEKKAIQELSKRGVDIVVITDGDRGATAGDGQAQYHIKALETNPVGKTGAGDAFSTGFLHAILQSQDIVTALENGILNANSVMGHLGAQIGLLTESKLKAARKKYGSKLVVKKM